MKLRYIYTMEYYEAAGKDRMMQFTATCMELKDSMLNKVSQKKDRG